MPPLPLTADTEVRVSFPMAMFPLLHLTVMLRGILTSFDSQCWQLT